MSSSDMLVDPSSTFPPLPPPTSPSISTSSSSSSPPHQLPSLHPFTQHYPSPITQTLLQTHATNKLETLKTLVDSLVCEDCAFMDKACAQLMNQVHSISEKLVTLPSDFRISIVEKILLLVSAVEEVDELKMMGSDVEVLDYTLPPIIEIAYHNPPSVSVSTSSVIPHPTKTMKVTKPVLSTTTRSRLLYSFNTLLFKKIHLQKYTNESLVLFPNNISNSNKSSSNVKSMTINWKPIYLLLLRNLPTLDLTILTPPKLTRNADDFNTRVNEAIYHSRSFFPNADDESAVQVWNTIERDLKNVNSQVCIRALIIFVRFCPTYCSVVFYERMLPIWLEHLTLIDGCTEWDYLFLTLFCRARKFTAASFPCEKIHYKIRRHILALTTTYLKIPLASSGTHAFPSVQTRGVGFSMFWRRVMGEGSLNGKIAKILIWSLGRDDHPDLSTSTSTASSKGKYDVSTGTQDLLDFLSYIEPYFNSSNYGGWSAQLSGFLKHLTLELSSRVGRQHSSEHFKSLNQPDLAAKSSFYCALPPHELCLIVDKLYPLTLQTIFSKHPQISLSGQKSLQTLSSFCPSLFTPLTLQLAGSALSGETLNQTHQAPCMLSTLAFMLHNFLRTSGGPTAFCDYMAEGILGMSLDGVDGNDDVKTFAVLNFYLFLVSFVNIGGGANTADGDDTDENKKEELFTIDLTGEWHDAALNLLPSTSPIRQTLLNFDPSSTAENLPSSLQNFKFAMRDWSLHFLDRVFTLLASIPPSTKSSKISYGQKAIERRVNEEIMKCRLVTACVNQMFISTSLHDSSYTNMLTKVCEFVRNNTMGDAVKEIAGIVYTAVAKDPEAGMKMFVPLLTSGLAGESKDTIRFRVRVLSSVVKPAGVIIVQYKDVIMNAIDLALSSEDGKTRKAGCKLIRHTLFSLTEFHIVPECMRSSDDVRYGKSADLLNEDGSLNGDFGVNWHVPSPSELDLASEIISKYLVTNLSVIDSVLLNFDSGSGNGNGNGNPSSDTRALLEKWRRALKVVHYVVRGSIGVMLDDYKVPHADADADDTADADTRHPYEQSIYKLVTTGTLQSTQTLLLPLRTKLCHKIADTMTKLTSTSSSPSTTQTHVESDLTRDAKGSSSLLSLSQLLLTVRAHIAKHSAGTAATLRQMKGVTVNYTMRARAGRVLRTCMNARTVGDGDGGSSHGGGSGRPVYLNGEEGGGKIVGRSMVVYRVACAVGGLVRGCGFDVPKRLKREAEFKFKSESTSGLGSGSETATTNTNTTTTTVTVTNTYPASVLSGYKALVLGLLSLTCHSNITVSTDAYRTVNRVSLNFGFIVQACTPRLLSALALTDSTDDGSESNTRLREVQTGVLLLLSTDASLKFLTSHRTHLYAFIRTYVSYGRTLDRFKEDSRKMEGVRSLLQGVLKRVRGRIMSDRREDGEEGRARGECFELLLGRLESNCCSSSASSSASTTSSSTSTSTATSSSSSSTNTGTSKDKDKITWREELTITWFLTNLLSPIEISDPTLVTRVLDVAVSLLEKGGRGQIIHRVALGLLGRLVGFMSTSTSNTSTSTAKATATLFWKRLGSIFENSQSFPQHLTSALSSDHKSSTGEPSKWSIGIDQILLDAGDEISGKHHFPTTRDTTLSSNSYNFKHSMFLTCLLTGLDDDVRVEACAKLMELAVGMARAGPSEDQGREHCAAAEVFGGVCRAMLCCSSKLKNAPSSSEGEQPSIIWLTLLPPLKQILTTACHTDAVRYWSDAFRFGITGASGEGIWPLIEVVLEGVEGCLWADDLTHHHHDGDSESSSSSFSSSSSSGAGSGSEDGFAIQAKWMMLLHPILTELQHGEGRGGGKGDNESLLTCILAKSKATSLQQTQTSSLSSSSSSSSQSQSHQSNKEAPLTPPNQATLKKISSRAIPRLLAAIHHPYKVCRMHVSWGLFVLSGVQNGRDGDDDCGGGDGGSSIDEIVRAFHAAIESDASSSTTNSNSNVVQQQIIEKKKRGRDTLLLFVANCLMRGDCRFVFKTGVLPLLRLAFGTLEVSDHSDDNNSGERGSKLISESKSETQVVVVSESGNEPSSGSNAAIEADLIKSCKSTLSYVANTSLMTYPSSHADTHTLLSILQASSEHKTWQIRQAACVILGKFQSKNWFLLDEVYRKRVLEVVMGMLGDVRTEVAASAGVALTGIIVYMGVEEVGELVRVNVGLARRSAVKGKVRKRPAVDEGTANAVVVDVEAANEKEKLRAKNQRTSVAILCAAINANPYAVPPYIPKAVAALSIHSFERSAPLVVRSLVKTTLADFKRTHVDNWSVDRKLFDEEELASLEDVSTCSYYA